MTKGLRDAARAEHLLAREGVTIGDNERIEPELVMALLEEREHLAEARQRGDLGEVERMAGAMRTRRGGAVERVMAGFAALEAEGEGGPGRVGDARAQELAQIKAQLILLRYVERYLEECDAALDED